jgi:hypothetical protein
VSTENTKAMQEALQAAVKHMNNGGGAAPTDPMGMLMTILPRLLPNGEEGEELSEKMEAVRKDVTGVRAEVRVLRKEIFRVFKMQEQLLAELGELQKQQLAVSQAVLDLAGQMARIEIIEEPRDDQGEDERGPATSAARPPRPGRNSRK